MKMTAAVEMRGVRKRYKDFTLDIPEMSLDRGYVLGLVGRNGAGKSTTLKIAMNLIYPDQGDVRILGRRQPEQELEIKRLVGYVEESPTFYEDMTVEWMAKLVSCYFPTWDNQLYRGYLTKFQLNPGKRVKELSKGMRVKLALMLALSHKPELLILDEPASGIDPVVRRELIQEIAEVIKDENRTVILSSHITQDIEQIADYVAILDSGRVVEHSDKESLMEKWKKVSGLMVGLSAEREGNAQVLSDLFAIYKTDGSSFMGITRDFSHSWLEKLKARGASDVKILNAGLDDILMSLVVKEVQNSVDSGI